jgi:hypothetical protein
MHRATLIRPAALGRGNASIPPAWKGKQRLREIKALNPESLFNDVELGFR